MCDITYETLDYILWRRERRPDCPLIELPPHGRLIDGDELRYLFADWYRVLSDEMKEVVALQYIDNTPTVIEAEGSEK